MDKRDREKQKAKAIRLLAEGKLLEKTIAKRVGITQQTLIKWKKTPFFQTQIAKAKSLVKLSMNDLSKEVELLIAKKTARVRRLNQDWLKMQRVIEKRGDDPAMRDVPGGDTGLLTVQIKSIGSGANFQEVREYRVDTGLLKELRETEKQAAIELGQWEEHHEHTHNLLVGSLTPEQQFARLLTELAARRNPLLASESSARASETD